MDPHLKNTIWGSRAQKTNYSPLSDLPGGFIVLIIKHNQSPPVTTALWAALLDAVQTGKKTPLMLEYISNNEYLTGSVGANEVSRCLSRCREKADKEKVGAGIESLLLRGCTVRNTEHAVGFVVYTGTGSTSSTALLLLALPA